MQQESRKRGYAAQEATRMEIVGIKHRLDGLEKFVEAISRRRPSWSA